MPRTLWKPVLPEAEPPLGAPPPLEDPLIRDRGAASILLGSLETAELGGFAITVVPAAAGGNAPGTTTDDGAPDSIGTPVITSGPQQAAPFVRLNTRLVTRLK
jgi:hypothetical protein